MYIATIFAVLECLTGRKVADEKSMDGVREVVGEDDDVRCRSSSRVLRLQSLSHALHQPPVASSYAEY